MHIWRLPMRYSFLFLVVLTISCSHRSDDDSELYTDYLIINYAAWTNLTNEIKTHELANRINPGDTLILPDTSMLMTHYDDSLIYGGEWLYLIMNDEVVAIEDIGSYIKAVTEHDSIGYLMSNKLKDDISDGTYMVGFKNKIDKINRERSKQLKGLMKRYGLSEAEFYKLIAKEHYRQTGNYLME